MKTLTFTTSVVCGVLLSWLIPDVAMLLVCCGTLAIVGIATRLSVDDEREP